MSDVLKGQVVLILGASSGIGRATTLMASRAGATVIGAARREALLAEAHDEFAREGIHLHTRRIDATDRASVTSVVDGVLQEFGRIDIAVYATGTNTVDRAMNVMSPETWQNVLDTNLNGAFYLSQAVLPSMRNAGGGHLIFVSSTAGVLADLSGAAYQASKRGLLGLAHAIRMEERSVGIRTCCIMPGLTDTELVEKRPQKVPADVLTHALQAEDVAATILHVMTAPPRVTFPEILMVPSLV